MPSHVRAGCLVGVALVAACGRAAPAAAPPQAEEPAPSAGSPSRVLAAVQVSGPWESLEAYCASVLNAPATADTDAFCSAAITVAGDAPFGDVVALQVSREDRSGDVVCAVGLEGADGWYVSAPSEAPCFEPSYIETDGVRVELVDGGARPIVAVHVDVAWHTKNFDDEARFTLTTLCGVRDGETRCTPLFVSACEAGAPAGDCTDAGYQLAWSVRGEVLSVTGPARVTGDDRALLGDHALGL